MEVIDDVQVLVRRDTLANLQADNPTLSDGELLWVSDTRDLIAGPCAFNDLWTAAQSIPNRAKVSADAAAATAVGLQSQVQSLVARGAAAGNVVLGSDQVHTPPADTNTGLEVVKSITKPDKTFLGALSGYAVYFGAEQSTAGSIQGGACEAYSLMNGTVSHAVLGSEGVGSVAGAGSYQQVIGLASTVQAKDTTSVQQFIGCQARGPVGSGTPTVANAYAVKVLEPSVGTERHALHVTGRTTLALGAHSSILEILGTSSVRRWGIDGGGVFTGYGSDGTSVRTKISTNEETGGKVLSDAYTGTTKHLSLRWQGAERLAVLAEGYLMFSDALRQTAVGTAGTAAALPSAPTTYIQVRTAAGNTLVIPAYAAA
jgi:hypothetical protein